MCSTFPPVPLYIRKAGENDTIDMERIYENDLEYILDYLNQAFYIDWDKMMQIPSCRLLISYHARLSLYPSFFQVLLNALVAEETKMIVYQEDRLSKKFKKKKKQERLKKDSGIFIDLDQKLLISRPLIGFLLWQYKQSID